MLRSLSSIRLTFITLSAMLGLMTSAIFLSTQPGHKTIILSMNHTLVMDWLISQGREHWHWALWLIGICSAAAVLFINTIFCSMTRQLVPALKINSPRRWAFLLLHWLFLLVLSCHGLSLIVGDKQENITLFPGQKHTFKDNFSIELLEVSYTADPNILSLPVQESRTLMTREKFIRKENTVSLSVSKGEELLASKTIYMLSPLRTDGVQVTLTSFAPGSKESGERTGATLTLSRNPLTVFFFTSYALMIVTLITFIFITWKPDLKEEPHETPQNS